MARRRRRAKTKTRRVYVKAKPKRRRRRSSGSGIKGLFKDAIPIVAYGAGRGYLAQMLMPLTSKLGMMGTYAPNASLGLAAWGVGKVAPGMKKYTNQIIKAEVLMASLKLGSALGSGMMFGTGSEGSSEVVYS